MRDEIIADWVDRVPAASRKAGAVLPWLEKVASKGRLRLLTSITIQALGECDVHRDPLLLSSFPDIQSMVQGITVM